MSFVPLVLLALQAGSIPAVTPDSALSRTRPTIDIACNVIGPDLAVRSVSFRFSGVQGFPASKPGEFDQTDAVLTVVQDQTGMFVEGQALTDGSGDGKVAADWQFGSAYSFDSTGQILTGARFFANSYRSSAAVVIERQTPPMMAAAPDFRFAGTCRFVATPLRPLDAAPLKKDRRQ